MPSKEKALRGVMKSAIENLINQEIRLLRLRQVDTPPLVIEEVSFSIRESKKQVIELSQSMSHKERTVLIKRMIRQVVGEEIDRTIQLRKNRCLRCLHVRFYDETGTAHLNLPIGPSQAQIIGCVMEQQDPGIECWKFIERPRATTLEDYLNEMTLLYEFREMIDRINEIWEDYFIP